MPHLNLEYSKNLLLNAQAALLQLNTALIESGQFLEDEIQSRATGFDDFLIGNVGEGRAFIHIKLRILSGRSAEIKKSLAAALVQAIHIDNPAQLNIQIRAEIIDIDRDSYAKRNINE
jgi:5-carboxymethyl-2-hydroxymuconate isomerase